MIIELLNCHALLEGQHLSLIMASNLDYAEDIEEAKAYMAKKNVFQLFEVSCLNCNHWI